MNPEDRRRIATRAQIIFEGEAGGKTFADFLKHYCGKPQFEDMEDADFIKLKEELKPTKAQWAKIGFLCDELGFMGDLGSEELRAAVAHVTNDRVKQTRFLARPQAKRLINHLESRRDRQPAYLTTLNRDAARRRPPGEEPKPGRENAPLVAETSEAVDLDRPIRVSCKPFAAPLPGSRDI